MYAIKNHVCVGCGTHTRNRGRFVYTVSLLQLNQTFFIKFFGGICSALQGVFCTSCLFCMHIVAQAFGVNECFVGDIVPLVRLE